MNYELCIFDLDGVIVDTAKFHYLAWRRLANELGFDLTLEENELLKGVSRMASLDIVLKIGKKSFPDHIREELASKKNQWYVEYLSRITEEDILPGVADFIRELKAEKIKVALGSASKNALYILDKLNLTSSFDTVIDGTKVSNAKPDPEVFLTAALDLGIPAEKCLVFEDAPAGVEAAKRAGMDCVGVGSTDVLGDADFVISSFSLFTLRSPFFSEISHS